MNRELKDIYGKLESKHLKLLELHLQRDAAALTGEKRKSWQEIADELGVSDRTVRKWKSNPSYIQAYKLRTIDRHASFAGEVTNRLYQSIMKGTKNGELSVKAIDLYLKLIGMLDPARIEIVERNDNVRDAEALRKRANELLARFKKDDKETSD